MPRCGRTEPSTVQDESPAPAFRIDLGHAETEGVTNRVVCDLRDGYNSVRSDTDRCRRSFLCQVSRIANEKLVRGKSRDIRHCACSHPNSRDTRLFFAGLRYANIGFGPNLLTSVLGP